MKRCTVARPFAAALAIGLLFAMPARAAHPSLLFDGAGLEQLQARRTNAAHRELAEALAAAVNDQAGATLSPSHFGDARLVANALGGIALASAILGSDGHRQLARASLLASAGWSDWGFGEGDDLNRGHMLVAASIAYDVLHPILTESERTSVRTKLASEAQRFADAVESDIWWKTDLVQNHNWINFAGLGLAAYALEGEDARAADWLAKALENAARVKAVQDLVTDGSWHEGVGYQEYGLSMSLPFWLAAARRGTVLDDTAMLRAFGTYRLYTQLPDLPRGYIATHGDWSGWAGPGSVSVLRHAAKRFRDANAAEAARRWIEAGPRPSNPYDALHLALEYVAFDASLEPADTSAIARDFYGDDQQLAVLRSGFEPGALVVGLKSGVLGGRGNFERMKDDGFPGGILNIGHDHMDDLGLWIYGDGEWLMPECPGYNVGRTSAPKAWMTEFHNTLLFDGAGQLGDTRGDLHSATAHAWFHQRDAHLPLVASTAHYAFARGDGTKLYPASAGLRGLGRTIGLARDGWMVLRDDVVLDGAHRVEQVFHFMDRATQSGSWIRGDSKNGRVLGVNVVAPSTFTATLGTQTADNIDKHFEPDGSVATARVSTSASGSATFLELLWPTRADRWGERPDAAPLDDARPELGVDIPLPDGRERWIFGTGERVEAGGLSTTGELAIVRSSASGAPARVVLAGTGAVSEAGHELLSFGSHGVLEVEWIGARASITGTGATAIRFHGPEITDVRLNGEPVPWHRDGEMVVLGVGAPPPDPDGGVIGPAPDGGASGGSPARKAMRVVAGCGCSTGEFASALALGALAFAVRRRRR